MTSEDSRPRGSSRRPFPLGAAALRPLPLPVPLSRLLLLVPLLGAGAGLPSGCKKTLRAPHHQFQGETMGTTYLVTIVPEGGHLLPEPGREDLAAKIRTRLEEVDEKMSTYRATSELSRLNAHADATPFELSAETLEVLDVALRIAEESGGALDITVGPLVDAWGFGPGGRPVTVPDDERIGALRERVGYRKIRIDREASAVTKARGDVACDLSAVAKGYAVDRVAELLDSLGFRHYMVEVGGEVRTRGRNRDGEAWRIAIERPVRFARIVERIVPLSGASVATSGDYRNFYDAGGRRVSHILDPRTGRPISHKLASASVFHERCAVADGYATAILVLGPEEGYRLAVDRGLAVLLLVRQDEEGRAFTQVTTPAFEDLLRRELRRE